MSDIPAAWMRTRELASYLGVHRNTLGNMLRQGLLQVGIHLCKINPLAPRGEFLWNEEVVLMTLGRYDCWCTHMHKKSPRFS